MRSLTAKEGYFEWTRESTHSAVRAYREQYAALDRVLRENPQLVRAAHREFCRALGTSSGGRAAAYSSEELLRALFVACLEGDSYRQAVIRIDTSEFLRGFVGLGWKATMDYSFLAKAFGALSEQTWQAMNAHLARYAQAQGHVSEERLRVDTTVVETNIHYPSDSSLLWDSWRVLARLLGRIQQECPELALRHRYHPRKVKRLATFIARYAGSPSKRTQQQVRGRYGTLIERVRALEERSRRVLAQLDAAGYEAPELARYQPTVAKIVHQAEQRVLRGGSVPNAEKVFSLFEAHTELLKRGKAGKPVEFGHKVVVAQTGEKFIHHYEVLAKQCDDALLLEGTLEAHRRLFGAPPQLAAMDVGFYENREQLERLRKGIETVSMRKRGRRTEEEKRREASEAFRAGQRFRAGVEGSISVLKRVFRLNRCLYKGFKQYASAVGCAVLCHNLVLLARL